MPTKNSFEGFMLQRPKCDGILLAESIDIIEKTTITYLTYIIIYMV